MSKAPIGDDCTQHWICACVVVVVKVVVVETETPAGTGTTVGVEASDPHGSAAHEPFDVVPTQTLPPRGARHAAARRKVWQCVAPFVSVRQHRTALGRPQVERAAQARSSALHSSESVSLLTTPATQRTYWWRVFTVEQSHWLSAACRAAATALASSGLSPHAAKALCASATRDRPAIIAPIAGRLSTNRQRPASARLAGIGVRCERSIGSTFLRSPCRRFRRGTERTRAVNDGRRARGGRVTPGGFGCQGGLARMWHARIGTTFAAGSPVAYRLTVMPSGREARRPSAAR